MSTQSLSTVAIDVVGQYHLAGQHLARAYQSGVQRAAGAISERFASALQSRELPLVNNAVKASVIRSLQKRKSWVPVRAALVPPGPDAAEEVGGGFVGALGGKRRRRGSGRRIGWACAGGVRGLVEHHGSGSCNGGVRTIRSGGCRASRAAKPARAIRSGHVRCACAHRASHRCHVRCVEPPTLPCIRL